MRLDNILNPTQTDCHRNLLHRGIHNRQLLRNPPTYNIKSNITLRNSFISIEIIRIDTIPFIFDFPVELLHVIDDLFLWYHFLGMALWWG